MIPETITNQQVLTVLHLQNNSLAVTIPETIGNLQASMVVFLQSKSLTGTIPETIKHLQALTRMLWPGQYDHPGGDRKPSGADPIYGLVPQSSAVVQKRLSMCEHQVDQHRGHLGPDGSVLGGDQVLAARRGL